MKSKHTHRRMKSFQICKCGLYMGLPRTFITVKELESFMQKEYKRGFKDGKAEEQNKMYTVNTDNFQLAKSKRLLGGKE